MIMIINLQDVPTYTPHTGHSSLGDSLAATAIMMVVLGVIRMFKKGE